jgi:hypothetical protein
MITDDGTSRANFKHAATGFPLISKGSASKKRPGQFFAEMAGATLLQNVDMS